MRNWCSLAAAGNTRDHRKMFVEGIEQHVVMVERTRRAQRLRNKGGIQHGRLRSHEPGKGSEGPPCPDAGVA